jgi:hypothetical protein
LLRLYPGHVRDHHDHRLNGLGIDESESWVSLVFTRPKHVVRGFKQPWIWCRIQRNERKRSLAPFVGPKNKKVNLSQVHFIVQNYLEACQIFQKCLK